MSDNDYAPNQGQGKDNPEADSIDLTREDQAADSQSENQAAEQIADLQDRILRLAAELENTRRRAEREKVDAGKYAIAGFARDLLAVADNFERALRAAGDETAEPTAEVISGLISGLKMTEKELLTAFERHGVRRIDPKGEKFDPNLHQAVAQAPGGEIPAGHVADVAQPGFTIGDRVLRAAMVIVSTGATKSEENGGAGAHVDTSA